ncbi:hypothetical protein [Dyadobacter sp. CY323]|uniref:hypothetical protein n=1 Tax=Dyadobacter sp. CY323 TaxID=2907302 RepID=UPI001F32C104|nr:hypothetical protein [Dyadobacter sp. CY323]MCE6992781.1 hypothetical protein [Dyadobacter sp. CY323]
MDAEVADIKTFGRFDLEKDPFETNNLAARETIRASGLKKSLDSVFADITAGSLLAPRRIVIDTSHEPVSVLTRQDLLGTGVGAWLSDKVFGYWIQKSAAAQRQLPDRNLV